MMIDKQEVIAFFDRCAPTWDAEMIRNETAIAAILDNAGVRAGVDVLDVACGTGVLFPDYLKRGVRSVTGVDISSEMAKIAAAKYPAAPIKVVCGDIETLSSDRLFDVVMVYNAFPHFPDPGRLIAALAGQAKAGGRLSIAHGMSRTQIDGHHRGAASRVSAGLLHEDALKALLAPYFDVDVVISNDEMYQVAGVKRVGL